MFKDRIKEFTIFIVVNFVAFGVHKLIESNFFSEAKEYVVNLPASYILNIVVSIAVCLLLLSLSKMFESQIGFIYLGFSVLKMMILYIALNPTNSLGEVFKKDALAFLLPFGVNLVLELLFVVKLLKINDLMTSVKD